MSKNFVLKLLGLIFITGALPVLDLSSVAAQESSSVTASVPDRIAPSVPILISPANSSLNRDSTPTFVWQASSDNIAVTDYQLFIDGNVLFANIPTVAADNSLFTLTYDSSNNQYSLTPKTGISDGTHTWKIRALDARDNSADSATWSFSIDTQSPQFVITKIEDNVVSISAFDISTIPENPVELEENQPVISGTGESGSTINITVSSNSAAPETITITISDSGTWSWQMGILPRDTEINIDFVITDLAGNISILDDLKLILKSETIAVPGTTTPSPTVFPLPTPTTEPPLIEIPSLSPAEWRHEIIKQALPLLPPSLRESAADELLTPMASAIEPQVFKHRMGPLVLITPVAVSFGVIALLTPHLTIGILWQILLLLLPLLRRRNCGLVFSYQTNRGIPYAPVTYDGVLEFGEEIHKTVLTNVYGQFAPGKLPTGTYKVSVDHPGFPVSAAVAGSQKNGTRWYLGTNFEINEPVDACILIPVDQALSESKAKHWLIHLANLTNPRSGFRWFWLLLGGFLVFLYPSQFNLLILIAVALIYSIDAIMAPLLKK